MQSVLVRPIQRRLTDHSRPILYHGFAGGASSQLIDFSRNSTVNGWTLDANGDPVLTEFAIDEPAFVVDPATGRSLGYRALEGATNSLLWNRDLSQGVWDATGATVTQDSVGLDGVANKAFTVTDNDDARVERINQILSITDDSSVHTIVSYVKKDDDESRFPEIQLYLSGGGTEQQEAIQLNTKTGASYRRLTAGSSSVSDSGDWWRVFVSVPNNSTGNTSLLYRVFPAISVTLGGVDSSATGSIVYDFGGVYLNSEIAGPPIETQAEPVSTAPDNATEVLPESCRDGFVWVGRAYAPPLHSSDQVYMSIRGDDSNYVQLWRRANSDFLELLVITSTGTNTRTRFPDTADKEFRFAARIQQGSINLFVNGVEASILEDGYNVPSLDGALRVIGNRVSTGSRAWNSTIAFDELYPNPQDWTDADLQEASKL